MNLLLLITGIALASFIAGHTVALQRVRRATQKQLQIYRTLLQVGKGHE